MHELTEEIIKAHASDDIILKIDFDMDEVELPLSHAIPLGLISNEIIVNAIKHAFIGRNEGMVRIVLKRQTSSLKFLR